MQTHFHSWMVMTVSGLGAAVVESEEAMAEKEELSLASGCRIFHTVYVYAI